MPTAVENINYLYLILTNDGPPTAITWADIAAKCGTTSGAASKRFSRMKQAFEKDGGMPSTGKATSTSANANASASTRKAKKTTDSPGDDGDTDVAQIPTLKDKRKALADDEDNKSKRVKSAKVIPKPKGIGKGKSKAKLGDDAKTVVEGEDIVKTEMPDEQDDIHDATEHVEDDGHDSVDNDGHEREFSSLLIISLSVFCVLYDLPLRILSRYHLSSKSPLTTHNTQHQH
ncbi:hypothetical protein J1614_001242 [Plenodomus biglobosus]|nr:hypothetical protein J1614_001242 [Plenodomus biglobosus]